MFGVFVRIFFMMWLVSGVVIAFFGFREGDFWVMLLGGLIIWAVAVLWSLRIEADHERLRNFPLFLEWVN